jgi:hypothetical protein
MSYTDFLNTNNKWSTYYEDRYPDKMVKAAKYYFGNGSKKEYPGGEEWLK